MKNKIIGVNNISKEYELGLIGSADLRSTLSNFFSLLRKKRESKNEIFSALKNISFDVDEGEVVGIIGRNGAGKSTLLKVLSQITLPTSGTIELNGRIASLLEVGTGFHPELSGRENIYLNGSILGMSKEEIKSKFDQIVAFAGVEKFLDTPVKRYSSGMYVRLAFSVAAHLEPEILVVDEVLSVGDAEFQKKCLGKMKESSNSGRTVLFVSHNMAAVKTLCSRAIFLKNGSIDYDGDVDTAVSKYFNSFNSSKTKIHYDDEDNGICKLSSVHIFAKGKKVGDPITMADAIQIETTFQKIDKEGRLDTTIHVLDEEGTVLFATSSNSIEAKTNDGKTGTYKSICLIPENFFNEGSISLNLYIVKDFRVVIKFYDFVANINISSKPVIAGRWMGKSKGVLKPALPWEVSQIR